MYEAYEYLSKNIHRKNKDNQESSIISNSLQSELDTLC